MSNYIDPADVASHVEEYIVEEMLGQLRNAIDEVNTEYTHDGCEDEIVDEAYCILIKNIYRRAFK